MSTEDSTQDGTSTKCVWDGEAVQPSHGATVTPIYQNVTFAYDDLDTWRAVGSGEKPGHVYSRNTNPTVKVFEQKMRSLEGAEATTSFSTGMAAISNTLFTLLSSGDRIVSIKDSYGGTNKILNDVLPRFNVNVTLCETANHDAIE